MEFLATEAAAFVKKTIPAKYNNSLGPAAPWADDVRSLLMVDQIQWLIYRLLTRHYYR
jgi:hypothetical protein